jgi:hypothetical protein
MLEGQPVLCAWGNQKIGGKRTPLAATGFAYDRICSLPVNFWLLNLCSENTPTERSRRAFASTVEVDVGHARGS